MQNPQDNQEFMFVGHNYLGILADYEQLNRDLQKYGPNVRIGPPLDSTTFELIQGHHDGISLYAHDPTKEFFETKSLYTAMEELTDFLRDR